MLQERSLRYESNNIRKFAERKSKSGLTGSQSNVVSSSMYLSLSSSINHLTRLPVLLHWTVYELIPSFRLSTTKHPHPTFHFCGPATRFSFMGPFALSVSCISFNWLLICCSVWEVVRKSMISTKMVFTNETMTYIWNVSPFTITRSVPTSLLRGLS